MSPASLMVWWGERKGRVPTRPRASSRTPATLWMRFDGLIERHGRQNCRDALGEHGLARSGRSDKQNVMTARASDLQTALRCLLAVDVTQVDCVLGCFGEQLVRIDAHRLKRFRRIHQIHCLWQGF